MSRKDNLKLLYKPLPEGMCDSEYESLEQDSIDFETFQYSHESSTKHVLVQGVYVGSASPLIADIKTQPYSMLTYMDDGMMIGTYDNTHDIPIHVVNGLTLNIMPTHFYDKAYYLHHLLRARTAAQMIHTGNGPVKTHFWVDILLNVQGCMVQFKLLLCDTQAQTGLLLSKMALEQLQTWQDYSTKTLYIKQTAIPLHTIQNIELLPERTTMIKVIADRSNNRQYQDLIQGQSIVWVWSNDSSKPLQPIVATFHNDKTLITFENTTGQTQHISKGAKVAVLDMCSKDGAMTNFEWDIPMDDEGNLVLYAHTFASTLEPTKLANEDPLLQAETKIDVSQTLKEHTVGKEDSEDPYLEGSKLKVSDALSRLYSEEEHKISDVIPLNFLLHFTDYQLHKESDHLANKLYAHKRTKLNTKSQHSYDRQAKHKPVERYEPPKKNKKSNKATAVAKINECQYVNAFSGNPDNNTNE